MRYYIIMYFLIRGISLWLVLSSKNSGFMVNKLSVEVVVISNKVSSNL